MKVKQYLIVEDNESDALHLVGQLSKFPFFNLVGIVPTIEGAIELCQSQPIDLLFLDVRLNQESGLTLLKSAANLPPVIITSAYHEYAVDTYEIGRAADYLLKPFSHQRLHIALTRALQLQVNSSSIVDVNAVYLKMGRKIQRFDFKNIDYVEAFGIYSKLYTGDQMSLVNGRITLMNQLLPNRIFIRVHKSFIININKITSFNRQTIWIGQTKIPIGVSYRPRLEGILTLLEGSDEPAD
jgi:DNA-binding LytR/AlgR family response regulator